MLVVVTVLVSVKIMAWDGRMVLPGPLRLWAGAIHALSSGPHCSPLPSVLQPIFYIRSQPSYRNALRQGSLHL